MHRWQSIPDQHYQNGGGEKGLHPTQKPVELELWLIRTYTDEGAIVLEWYSSPLKKKVSAIDKD